MGINLNHRDEQFMRLALAQAHLAESAGEVPVGAVVVHNDQVVAQAHNQMITQSNPTAHAEILVLQQAGLTLGNYRLIDCELFVTLEPCTMCAGACIHGRIKRVVYGASDAKTGVVDSVDEIFKQAHHNHRVESLGGVLKPECSQILSQFFAKRRAMKKFDSE